MFKLLIIRLISVELKLHLTSSLMSAASHSEHDTERGTQDYTPLQRQTTDNQTISHICKTLNWLTNCDFLPI